MVVIVRETQKLKKRTKVERIKLEEVWLSVPCNTYCKMGYINGEHQFRVKEDPQRKPIQGTEKGKQAEEADALAKKALLIIEYLSRKKAEQLETRGDDGGRRGGGRPQGDGVVAGHAGFHGAVREGVLVRDEEVQDRLLCLEALLPEANARLDQHGILGADGDAERGSGQVQGEVPIWEDRAQGLLGAHLLDRA